LQQAKILPARHEHRLRRILSVNTRRNLTELSTADAVRLQHCKRPTHGNAPCGIDIIDSRHSVVIICGLYLRRGSRLPSLQRLRPQLDHGVQWLSLGARVLR